MKSETKIELAVWLVVAIAVIGFKAVDVYFIHNIPTIVKQNGTVVYSGPSACVQCTSAGDNTQVKIKGTFLCLLPKAIYVGKGITIEATK